MHKTCLPHETFSIFTPDSRNTILPAPEDVEQGVWLFTARLGARMTPRGLLQRAESLLSQEETVKANSFAFSPLKYNYVFSHAFLRILLSKFATSRPPDKICFNYNPYGKPYLTDNPGGLQFSMSHSGEMVLVALARAEALGADIEPFSPGRNNTGVAGMCFSPGELAAFHTAPCPDRVFYHIWTRKEAWLKAVGTGLVDDMNALEVTSSEPLYRNRHTGYSCVSLDVDPGHAAALSFAGLQTAPVFHVCAPATLAELL